MDIKTAEALEESIKKWEDIAAGTGVDLGKRNCALCGLFWDNDCVGCPVFKITGFTGCRETPYTKFMFSVRDSGSGRQAKTEEEKELAQREVDFLKSLRGDT